MRTDTLTLVAALRALANDIESEDGVANAAIAEAADRLEEYHSFRSIQPAFRNDLSPVSVAIEAMNALTDEQRMDVIFGFCVYCGCVQDDPPAKRCQCWRDE